MRTETKEIVDNVLVILENCTKNKVVPSSSLIKKLNSFYNKKLNSSINGDISVKDINKLQELVDKTVEGLIRVHADNYKYVNSCLLSSKRLFLGARKILNKSPNDIKNFEDVEDFKFCVNIIFQGLEHLVLASLINEGKIKNANVYRRSMDSSVKDELTDMVHNFLINY